MRSELEDRYSALVNRGRKNTPTYDEFRRDMVDVHTRIEVAINARF